jgi:2Fe-2S ferredoxin
MPTIFVKNLSGEEVEINTDSDISVMEALRDNGVDELLAICGGCLSCATCHIYVDAADMDKLPERSDDEKDLLETLEHTNERSRLSCQIQVTDAMDGIRLEVAPEE